jgi:hypothetical protein
MDALLSLGFDQNLKLAPLLSAQRLQLDVLNVQLLQLSHCRRTYNVILGSLLVKSRKTKPQLPALPWNREADLDPLWRLNKLTIGKFWIFIAQHALLSGKFYF